MAGQQGQQKKSDGLYAIGGFTAIAAVILYLLWMKDRKALILFIYGIDYIQYIIVHFLGFVIPYIGDDSSKWMHYIYKVLTSAPDYDPRRVSIAELSKTQADIGQRTFIFYTALCGFLAWKVRKNMLGDGIKRAFTLIGGKGKPSFIEYQSRYWTEAKFAVGFNPETCLDSQKSPLKPIPWLLKNEIGLSKEKGLDFNKLEKIFLNQVGNKWVDFKSSPFYIQAFLSMCMTTLQHGGEDGYIDKYRSILNNIFYDRSLKEDEIKEKILSAVDDMAKYDPKMIPEIERIINNKHYYIRTGCLGIIGWCGPFKNWGGGFGQIISPAMYQWLMKYDRTLFMALQAHGKFGICSYVEGAGVVSHYLIERTAGSPISDKYITSAVNGIKENLELHNITDFDDMNKTLNEIDRRY